MKNSPRTTCFHAFLNYSLLQALPKRGAKECRCCCCYPPFFTVMATCRAGESEPRSRGAKKNARTVPKNFLNNSRALPNKTRALRQIAPESSPESSAKSSLGYLFCPSRVVDPRERPRAHPRERPQQQIFPVFSPSRTPHESSHKRSHELCWVRAASGLFFGEQLPV